mmetsp:Transcript_17079/g.25448  ORF Transcript_17079/g.25448 Transcript_17079/m.25448 type:complete len:430 (+) Transcript_17079:643-1932(+)
MTVDSGEKNKSSNGRLLPKEKSNNKGNALTAEEDDNSSDLYEEGLSIGCFIETDPNNSVSSRAHQWMSMIEEKSKARLNTRIPPINAKSHVHLEMPVEKDDTESANAEDEETKPLIKSKELDQINEADEDSSGRRKVPESAEDKHEEIERQGVNRKTSEGGYSENFSKTTPRNVENHESSEDDQPERNSVFISAVDRGSIFQFSVTGASSDSGDNSSLFLFEQENSEMYEKKGREELDGENVFRPSMHPHKQKRPQYSKEKSFVFDSVAIDSQNTNLGDYRYHESSSNNHNARAAPISKTEVEFHFDETFYSDEDSSHDDTARKKPVQKSTFFSRLQACTAPIMKGDTGSEIGAPLSRLQTCAGPIRGGDARSETGVPLARLAFLRTNPSSPNGVLKSTAKKLSTVVLCGRPTIFFEENGDKTEANDDV